jgi:catechol 2,3-dioxygenase-like lactoylglutathione lyase family enzyme
MAYTLNENITGIDHLALAVPDLANATCWMRDVLGFRLGNVRETFGKYFGMKSAVLRLVSITIVLT